MDRKSIEIRKTFFFSSSNTHQDVQTRTQQLLGVPSIRHFEKYLELPAFAGRAKKQNFVYIKEMVWKKASRLERKALISGWKGGTDQSNNPSLIP